MKLNLLSIILLNGFAPAALFLQPAAPIYYFVSKAFNWQDARSYCRATYTDLAPIKTYADLLKIRAASTSHGTIHPLWVGLSTDVDGWRWSFHDLSLSALTFQNWDDGEPDNLSGDSSCGAITNTGTWWNMECSAMLHVICYNAHYPGDSRFVNITTRMNWTDAQTYCRRFHTDLATALDAADNSVVQQLIAKQGIFWFGLYRDGWTWTDQTKAPDVYWTPGQPDNLNGDENCGKFYQGFMDDETCTNGYYFYCYYIPPIKRKMLKLQVKSDQNIFDAAVQASLLMKIMQKLQEHGMSKDITVTWRVRPDGSVFYNKK